MRKERRTDKTKLMVAFHNSANVSETSRQDVVTHSCDINEYLKNQSATHTLVVAVGNDK
jgi:hypothetical protein